jgi:hypothetical protein
VPELKELLEQAKTRMREICREGFQLKVALDHLDQAQSWAAMAIPPDADHG